MRMKLSMLFIAISMIALVFGILFMTPIAGVWSVPGVFAFAGGGVSALTYRILRSGNAVEPQINSLTQPIDLS